MRVGLVAPFFPPDIGGANIYCFEFAKALGEAGHDVHVFAPRGAQPHPAYTLHAVLSLELDADLQHLRRHDMDVWHSLFFFYAPLAAHRPNVFVTGHGDDFFSLRLRYPLPRRAWLARHVLWRLDEGVRRRIERWLHQRELAWNRRIYARAVCQARQVIAVSSFSGTRLCAAYPAARGKTTVIPPGVGERFFEQSRVPRNARLLLTVTRLDEHDRIKNVHGVIAALGMLKDRYAFEYVIIAGGVVGGYRDELVAMIGRLGLQGRVRIEGRKSEAELLEYYQRAGLFVLASYAEPENFEGFGIVFLEANAAGAPVLTSRQGGMTDYVREGENGYYATDPSAEGLRDALQRYFEGQLSFDESRVRAAPQSYRWRNIAARIAAVYGRHGVHAGALQG
jgi:phosphatidylinositol alpha-1,6-mannosyltransferase